MRKFDSDKTLQLSMYLKIVACFLKISYIDVHISAFLMWEREQRALGAIQKMTWILGWSLIILIMQNSH